MSREKPRRRHASITAAVAHLRSRALPGEKRPRQSDGAGALPS